MKVWSVLFLLPLALSEWTCEDCARASNGLAIFSVNVEAIQAMVDVLIAEMCPAAEVPTICFEQLPGFWAEISRVIFPEHWKHICDDLEECEPAAKAAVPNCPECAARVNAITNALSLDYVIEAYVELCQNSPICENFAPDNTEDCKQALADLLPVALPLLAAQPREWPNVFCQGWGCEPWDPSTAMP